ncbi:MULTISPECIES: mechanosensitive ion channel family protein [unclassified Campylobacter]|uniref:mechanosensitive ion channel family protein n=1 Tax=unclassified Campylobacter TaxID=2593542 RepID=UPI0022E9F9B1|nr:MULTISPECIES: mechanosensitive ion channel family protein [unclassified Campylobacter]MDA3043263.1 mechanosensitive ion channel family protein [Campylobacter sp. JMF_09 ED2]MDA3045048.1 mechanosensitive ion channel family protein [Campylobacter sp. JMF_07 ED4]MDA3064352.1 mechanosensitive ion channel family protein [Campylobacter sp. JMF_11 EL3]MDA3071831.1 mechanosensitive ion channel family protein [Campylobacter sp. VBCF_03 NA9]MDA3075235.1 mechanosensitive ion channel family protein [Ca
MKKFLISFLISALCLNFIFAEANKSEANLTEQNSSQSAVPAPNLEEKKKEVEEFLSEVSGADANKSEVYDIIVNKVAQNELNANETNGANSFYRVVNEIKEINKKILAISPKGEANATDSSLKTLKENKARLLESVPMAITNNTLSREGLLKYAEIKKNIEDTLAKFAKKQNSIEYVSAAVSADRMALGDIFYQEILKLDNLFVNGASKDELKMSLEDALSRISEYSLDKTSKLKEALKSQEDAENFVAKFSELKNDKATYEEILSYLHSNADLLASSVIFTSLNFKSAIDSINEISPIKDRRINFGKIVLISAIMLFFYSLRRVLANLIYFVFKIINRSTAIDKETIKEQVVATIKRPLGVLLIAYSIDISLVIFFYPAPVPIRFASILSIIYVILWAWVIIEIIDGYGIIVLGNIAKKGVRKDVINLVIKILYIIVVIIALLLILKRLGFDVSAILASLGIGGLAIAFATKDIIANFFQSIMLLFDNSFSQGDHVVVGDIEGTVVETGFRKTTIRTFDNALVFVPNANIMAQNIKNWNRRKVGRHINIIVGVTYSARSEQLRKCIEDIKEMLKAHPRIAQSGDSATNSRDFRMRSRQNMVSIDDLAGYKSTMNVVLDSFGDSSVNILVYCFTKTVMRDDYLQIKEDILFKIMQIVENNGLEFAFPSQSLYVEKLPKFDYDNPKFSEGGEDERV